MLKSSLHRNRKIRPVERYRRSSASSLTGVWKTLMEKEKMLVTNSCSFHNFVPSKSKARYFKFEQAIKSLPNNIFRLVQIESICRQEIKFNLKVEIHFGIGRKHCGIRRKCCGRHCYRFKPRYIAVLDLGS